MILSDIVGQVHGLVLDHLPARTGSTPSGWRTLNCPMCTDRRHRGGVKVDGPAIGYNCFNCGYSTRWEPGSHLTQKYRDLAGRLGASDTDIHRVNLKLMQFRSELEGFSDHDVRPIGRFPTQSLPAEAVLVSDLNTHHPVRVYAEQRGLLGIYPVLWFDYQDMRERIKWRDRMVIPFMHNGELVGWTGRHINPANKETPKYLSNQPEGYVFNLDAQTSERKIIILTEGVIDAALIDGISVMGNTVNDQQARLINSLDATVVVCPDRDQAGNELIKAALAHGWRVSFPPWQANIKDVGDAVGEYGRLLTVASIIEHSTQNPTKIRVRSKLK